jgi:hypothetical protein
MLTSARHPTHPPQVWGVHPEGASRTRPWPHLLLAAPPRPSLLVSSPVLVGADGSCCHSHQRLPWPIELGLWVVVARVRWWLGPAACCWVCGPVLP